MTNFGIPGSRIFPVYNIPVGRLFFIKWNALRTILFVTKEVYFCILLSCLDHLGHLAFWIYNIDVLFLLLFHSPNFMLTCHILTVPPANYLIGMFWGKKKDVSRSPVYLYYHPNFVWNLRSFTYAKWYFEEETLVNIATLLSPRRSAFKYVGIINF